MTHFARTTSHLLLEDPTSGVRIASRGDSVSINVTASESEAVRTAVDNLRTDLSRACGASSTLADAAAAQVIVGTVGVSQPVDEAVADGLLDISPLLDGQGNLRWEARMARVVGNVLFLVGADRRGTIYAIYDFCRAIGVSPWSWWADVPVRTRDHITLPRNSVAADYPSVRYRGIFLNDEEELEAWAQEHTQDGGIGPETYARVCELLLRLGANYLWPAMHVAAFNENPANGRTAHDLGVVVGTSHCDMLLRSNEHEFATWATAQPRPVAYDYSIPGQNRDLLQDYWRLSVEQNRDFEVTWNVGMRGIHDYGFQTSAIDDDPKLSEEDKANARVELLERVIADQRDLLSQSLGLPASQAPQLFIPYKEVLPLYDAGLEVPDDVTIVWTNDSYGHVRRLPDETELKRPGGHGLYYHASYWADLTSSYLATSSTPLPLMQAELTRAWRGGVQRLWMLNIGGLKPLEHELEFFTALAWEVGRESRTADVDTFTADWIDDWFTGLHGTEVAAIHGLYSQLNQQRKLEHLEADTFSQVVHGDEAGRRFARLRELALRSMAVLEALPRTERPAFFQLIVVKVQMAHHMAGLYYHADRSRLVHDQGKHAAADHHLALSRAHDDAIRALVHHYNHGLSNGKWSGMFTPQAFPPPVIPLHPAGKPALHIGVPGLGVVVWGEQAQSDTPSLVFHAQGVSTKWLEVFTTGTPLAYTIEAEPWINLSQTSGTVKTEHRIQVSIADHSAVSGRSGAIRVTSSTTGETVTVTVAVAPAPLLPEGFAGAVEADGHVTLDPAAPDALEESAWEAMPRLGRYGNAALRSSPGVGEAGAAYSFFLTTAGAHLLEVHRLPTLDATGQIRVGISVDAHPPMILESDITDEHRGEWRQAVRDNVEVLRAYLPSLRPGPHTLSLHAVDANVIVSKIVVRTEWAHTSRLGPEFSIHTQRSRDPMVDPDPTALSPAHLRTEVIRWYGTDPADIDPPEQVYVGEEFWIGPTVFKPNVTHRQQPGRACRYVAADGAKDVLNQLGSGIALEQDGVIAYEAENALANNETAWTTPAFDCEDHAWTHTQAESEARTGLAMHVEPRGLRWGPGRGPALHQRIRVSSDGRFRVWLLAKYDDHTDDRVEVVVDGTPQDISAQFCGGALSTYGTRQTWNWVLLSEIYLAAGDHIFSLAARRSGLRIDRIFLARSQDLPPVDADWVPSPLA